MKEETWEIKEEIIKMIKIKFSCQYLNGQWIKFYLKPNEYFEIDLDKELDVWSLPKYDDLIDYIKFEKSNVVTIITTIRDYNNDHSVTFTQTFWNNQQNYLIETVEEEKNEKTIEIIMQSLIEEKKGIKKWEVIRFKRDENSIKPIFHSIIEEDENKLIEEKIIPIQG